MGFMDRAKKLAEQAQQKLDEAQKQFGQSGSPQSQSQQAGTRYDEHGRPIQEGPPAGEAPPPSAEPAAPKDAGGANDTPDPFKPIQK
jgi:hypothetical protein